MRFTKKQIEDWKLYEDVRLSGAYNMITHSSQAAEMAGLDREEHWFCLKNYNELKEAAEKREGRGK